MRSSPRARIAKARNFPNRFKLKSERCSQESSGGKTFSNGMATSRMKPTIQKARLPPPGATDSDSFDAAMVYVLRFRLLTPQAKQVEVKAEVERKKCCASSQP